MNDKWIKYKWIKLIQRERNRLAERGVELTPDEAEELVLHKLRCLTESSTCATVSVRLLVRQINKTSKLLSKFSDAAGLVAVHVHP